MDNQKAMGSLKKRLCELMGAAVELTNGLEPKEQPVMEMVNAQMQAAYRSLLISEGILFPASALEAKPKVQRKEYSANGWVKLTEAQHTALVERYGEELLGRAIAYIDESAQNNGNRNGWKDWSGVIHKCIREDWGRVRSTPLSSPNKAAAEANIDWKVIGLMMKS